MKRLCLPFIMKCLTSCECRTWLHLETRNVSDLNTFKECVHNAFTKYCILLVFFFIMQQFDSIVFHNMSLSYSMHLCQKGKWKLLVTSWVVYAWMEFVKWDRERERDCFTFKKPNYYSFDQKLFSLIIYSNDKRILWPIYMKHMKDETNIAYYTVHIRTIQLKLVWF